MKQGCLASTNDYLKITTDGLNLFSDTKCGMCIGELYIGAPTLADDTICLATQTQELLDIIAFMANREHYTIHPGKSSITTFNSKYKMPPQRNRTT